VKRDLNPSPRPELENNSSKVCAYVRTNECRVNENNVVIDVDPVCDLTDDHSDQGGWSENLDSDVKMIVPSSISELNLLSRMSNVTVDPPMNRRNDEEISKKYDIGRSSTSPGGSRREDRVLCELNDRLIRSASPEMSMFGDGGVKVSSPQERFERPGLRDSNGHDRNGGIEEVDTEQKVISRGICSQLQRVFAMLAFSNRKYVFISCLPAQ